MEEKKNPNQPQEIRDEELDQVSGGADPTLIIIRPESYPFQSSQTTDSAAVPHPDPNPQPVQHIVVDNLLDSGSGPLCDPVPMPGHGFLTP